MGALACALRSVSTCLSLSFPTSGTQKVVPMCRSVPHPIGCGALSCCSQAWRMLVPWVPPHTNSMSSPARAGNLTASQSPETAAAPSRPPHSSPAWCCLHPMPLASCWRSGSQGWLVPDHAQPRSPHKQLLSLHLCSPPAKSFGRDCDAPRSPTCFLEWIQGCRSSQQRGRLPPFSISVTPLDTDAHEWGCTWWAMSALRGHFCTPSGSQL